VVGDARPMCRPRPRRESRRMITANALTKRYGSVHAVSDVTFICRPGTVTGFLGPNGAGKSTTLRMLTGLTPPTSGSVTVNGQRYAELPNPGRTVGVMLDAAAQHPGRTGRETLRLAAAVLDVPRNRADAILDQVGLAHAGGRRVGAYSLGMRQRLGIATALLGDPEILVLDEPANGMDPEGIRWMRELLQDFASRGGTVLLSSHLLAEVQATVDHLVVIGGGRVVASGELRDLLRGSGSLVRGLDPAALGTALTAAGLQTTTQPDGLFAVEATPEQVGRAAAGAGQVLLELREGRAALEDLYFTLTAGPAAAAAA
jgi:ABC-2 type transport system ATP-binding protein